MVGLHGSVKKSRLQGFAISMSSLLERSRTMAMNKGCPSRIIFCDTHDCSDPIQLTASRNALNAKSVALLRYAPRDSSLDCSSINHRSDDGYENWEFELRPISVPEGISVSAIYGDDGLVDISDWATSASPAAEKSIWFTSSGEMRSPTMNSHISEKLGELFLQVSFESCDPSQDSDCPGFLVSMDRDGAAHVTACSGSPVNCRGLAH